ncbi:unnamed protein product [Cylindrotheca closterium]|uniref:Uncharacterized protein n=1 Tax=Cylindrotheca closterium TaxID=2856 RepID=A0AAD2GB41_9STRA|nr:unnamed protein product [Cylindrotheca closterium]
MMTAETSPSSQLPAQFLAYKQKAEERKAQPAKMGNTNCWGSFSFPPMMSDPRTSVSSVAPNVSTNDTAFSSERSYGSSNGGIQERRASGGMSPNQQSNNNSSNSKIASMWSSFSNRLTGSDPSESPTHSAELSSKSGFPTNTKMTNVDRLKSMAASSVRKPDIPDAEPSPPPVTMTTQSSYPSLASTRSDGSSSLESSSAQSGRFFKFFGGAGNNAPKKATGIGSHQDPAIGELKNKKNGKDPNNNNAKPASFFSAMSTQSKDAATKKEIDIEKLKRLRDQAAGLVPRSPGAVALDDKNHHHHHHDETDLQKESSLESQIDDLEKEMGIAAAAAKEEEVPPKLRMDGFDDVHEEEAPKNYAEIKISTMTGVGNTQIPKKPSSPPKKKVSSPLAAAFIGSSPETQKGLSTAV